MPRKVDNLSGRYYRITPRFWQDRDVREWPEDARWLAIYLMTCPHRNMVGLFYCPTTYMESDLQWDNARLVKALDHCRKAGFVEYDDAAQVVFIVKLLKNDPLVNPNQAKSALKAIATLPKTRMVLRLYEEAAQYCEVLAQAMEQEIPDEVQQWYYEGTFVAETRIPYSVFRNRNQTSAQQDAQDTGSEGEDEPLKDSPSENTEGPAVGERKPKLRAPNTRSEAELLGKFDEFWNVYPRKNDKGRARQQWLARLRDKVDRPTAEELITAAKKYAHACEMEGRDQRYIKYAASFLGPTRSYKEWLEDDSTIAPEVQVARQKARAIASEKTQAWVNEIMAQDPTRKVEE